ncbi:MAG: helix-turn-helix transcriptional regulator [Symploca sp. SIO1B1]|nr:helix-turn-helix transcriptional regulator [Symploca sp. SIO1B1]
MIEWRLRVVMAERDIGVNELADLIGIHRVNVSRMKTAKTMPRLTEQTLDALCKALDCQPGDLLRYTSDEKEGANND